MTAWSKFKATAATAASLCSVEVVLLLIAV